MQRYTVYFNWKLLYVFRVVPPHLVFVRPLLLHFKILNRGLSYIW